MHADRRIVAWIVAGAALVSLVTALSFWAFQQIKAASAARDSSHILIRGAHKLLSDVIDAETGQRGYMLTRDESHLEHYLTVRNRVVGELKALHSLDSAGPGRRHLDALAPLVDAKLAHMAQVIETVRQNDVTSVAVLASLGQGKTLMDSIRDEIARYIDVENGVLSQSDADLLLNMRYLFALIVLTGLFAFLLMVSFVYFVYRETQHRISSVIHVETQRVLEVQEQSNRQLQRINGDLEVSEEKLAITLNSIGDGVIATDADGRVTIMNTLAQKLTGWPLNESLGHPVEEVFRIINQKTRLPSEVPVRDTLAHNTTHGLANHTILIARDGSECDIADSCAPIRTRAGQVVGAVLVFRDVTERTRIDKILQERTTALEIATAIAEKANLAKSDFLSSMSHELRTPLSAILGFAQLMESASPPPSVSQKRSIDQILKAGWYLLDLINEILDLALIESGKLSLSMEPLALSDVLRECEAMSESQARKHGISVNYPNVNGLYFVNADHTRLKQVISNLLSNAIKYNRAGGSVILSCVQTTPQVLRVNVRDTGAGISPDKLKQLFQPFNRLGQEMLMEEGTGIGLVVSKRLIELMGGAIGVSSTVGEGSEFWIDINLSTQPRTASEATRNPPPAELPAPAGSTVRTLLYVEDNPANLMLVEEIIVRRPDIRMLSATDGVSGIKMALDSLPDVILMDINLPGISGIEALRILAGDPATAHIPVIALSANAMPRDIERGLAAGFFRYLTKPIKVNEFLNTLDVALAFAAMQAVAAVTEENAQL